MTIDESLIAVCQSDSGDRAVWEQVDTLLLRGANPNAAQKQRYSLETPLLLAARRGRHDNR